MEDHRADDMTLVNDLRTLVFQRRIARATERIADALDEIRMLERSRWAKESGIRPAAIKKTEIGTLDIDEMNERYRKEQEAAEVGATLEDVS
jgi:hypothetical protein